MAREKIVGIYYIQNKINKKRYIGQSIDIEGRWNKHRNSLTNKRYSGDNKHITRAWHKYGEENFEFSIVMQCLEFELDYWETFWIDFYDSANWTRGYNKTRGGKYNYKMTYSEAELREMARYGEDSNYHVLDERDVRNIIKRFETGESNNSIAKDYGVDKGTIARIRNHKNWCYLTEGLDLRQSSYKEKYGITDNSIKVVDLYTLNGQFIKSYPSIRQAALELNCKDSNITKVCCGTNKSLLGYVWRYHNHPFDEFDISRANITMPVKVDQYDEKWQYLSTYTTMKEAQDITGISKVTIGRVVRGKSKTAGGYHWLRHGEQPPVNISEYKEENENAV